MAGYDLDFAVKSDSSAIIERLNEISGRLQRLENRVERLEHH